MHPEILSHEQKELLSLLKLFRREFYLVGGTAIALQIGHRMSIDFDLFKSTPFVSKRILKKIDASHCRYNVSYKDCEQMHLTVSNVKFTFFEYPYPIESPVDFNSVIKMPDLISLVAMKSFALGRRSKWKDYVDLYFFIKEYFSVNEIIQKAEVVFGQEFSGKLFRSQLAFHKDINYSEPVEYLDGFAVQDEEIKTFLIEKSLEW
jgi:hypothetical protein